MSTTTTARIVAAEMGCIALEWRRMTALKVVTTVDCFARLRLVLGCDVLMMMGNWASLRAVLGHAAAVCAMMKMRMMLVARFGGRMNEGKRTTRMRKALTRCCWTEPLVESPGGPRC